MTGSKLNAAEILNRECECVVTDLPKLRQRIENALDPARPIGESHPHLFSEIPVFLDRSQVDEMQDVINAVEDVIRLPGYRQAVLDYAPAIARVDARSAGVFMGFDFHLALDGPRLIEINTNAGGAFLNIAANDAQRTCCEAASVLIAGLPSAAQIEDTVISMFTREWALARGAAPLRTIAIVDENPSEQFLYPEFQLAKKLFESRGIQTHIADPSELRIAEGAVWLGEQRIGLIYNRLTDFYLETTRSSVLRTAYEGDLAIITPHPRTHALYANKQNLALLSDATLLGKFGASPQAIAALKKGVPPTREVTGCGETWWRTRKDWFFKPRNGFGSRGTYRGDKLTRRVFAEVVKGGYMAQAITPPSERWRSMSGVYEAFKLDLRCYVYAGKIQLLAARLYQGQTTNFRTAGGGFAPVYVIGKSDGETGGLNPCAQ